MDKFLVRTPRNIDSDAAKKIEKDTKLKQTTIDSLKCVVVVEDLRRLKSLLRLPSQSSDKLLQALDEVSQKIPPRHILQQTKIGHTINRLTKHADSDVASKAASVLRDWKKHFDEKLNRPMIEVRTDRKTQELRSAGQRHLQKALLGNAEEQMQEDFAIRLSEVLEREVFHQNSNLVSKKYRRTIRAMIFALQYKKPLCHSVVKGEMTPRDFVQMHEPKTHVT